MSYAIYLRRSRADEEAEARGEGETLSRHRKALFDLARSMSLPVTEVYQEIASGDTISGRPQMQRLLVDVASRKYLGVLCMSVDRLGRGDSMDQGYIMQTFLYSGTRIITPTKTYDPAVSSDFEFFEMQQFFARREYASIKNRMQAGRAMASKEGYYVASVEPYGYHIIPSPDGKSYTLAEDPERSPVVRQVFDWYVNGMDGRPVGCSIIADALNASGCRTNHGLKWDDGRINNLLKNPVYAGYVRWYTRRQSFEMRDGQRISRRLPGLDKICVRGVHAPLIDEATWQRAQEIRVANTTSRVAKERAFVFIFSGLLKCGVCGKAMRLQPNRTNSAHDIIKCSTAHCPNHGSYVTTIEKLVLEQLRQWSVAVPSSASNKKTDERAQRIAQLTKQLASLEAQRNRLYDLLESGTYTETVFLQRQDNLTQRETLLRAQIAAARADSAPSLADQIAAVAPLIDSMLSAYSTASTPLQKNQLLKSVISRMTYTKPRRRYSNEPEATAITLDIFPRTL